MRQYLGDFYGPLSMSTIILIAVDTLSIQPNLLIDDPERDVTYHCFMLLMNHNAAHMLCFAKDRPILYTFIAEARNVLFTCVNVAALVVTDSIIHKAESNFFEKLF